MERPGEDTIIRYFLGKCDPDEQKVVSAYLALKIDEDYVEACLREAFYKQEDGDDPAKEEQARERVWAALVAKQQVTPVVRLNPRKHWYRYAAAVALLFISVSIYLVNHHQKNTVSAIAWKQIQGKTGKPETITLADNSSITLFPGSTIAIPSNFNQTDRRIKLIGRAFFRITHNKEKPFYVAAQNLTTKVLGTSFEINSGKTESIITLHTGRISVTKANEEIARLTPDHQIDYQEATGKYDVVTVNAAGTLSWLNGELNYDRAPLSQVMQDIEKWYGVEIHADDPSLLTQKVIFSFKDQSLSRVLYLLSKSADFSYEINGKHVTLKERSMETN